MTADVTQWVQYGAPGMLAVVLFFVGKAALKLLDRFAASIDKLDSTIASLLTHVQASALSEAASMERRHAEILAAVERVRSERREENAVHVAAIMQTIERTSRETRHGIRNDLTVAKLIPPEAHHE